MPEDKFDDQVNVDDIAEGTDEDVKATSSPVANLFHSKLAKILGYSVAAILLIIISVLASVMLTKNANKKSYKEQDKPWVVKKAAPLSTLSLKEFKLSTADKKDTHFVRINIALGYKMNDMKLASELNARRAEIRDLINEIVMSKKKDEIDDEHEQQELKEEMLERINQILQDGKIDKIFFTDVSIM